MNTMVVIPRKLILDMIDSLQAIENIDDQLRVDLIIGLVDLLN
jgi:hypothetical protein